MQRFGGDMYADNPILFSPDGSQFIAITDRGSLERNAREDTIWLWSSDAVLAYGRYAAPLPPEPREIVRLGTNKNAPIITDARWSEDGRRVTFLAKGVDGNHRLYEVAVATGALFPLTPANQDVRAYDRSGSTVVYFAADVGNIHRIGADKSLSLSDVLFPLSRYPEQRFSVERCQLWEIVGQSPPHVVGQSQSSHSIRGYEPLWAFGSYRRLKISSDGRYVIAILPVDRVPDAWTEYRPWRGVASSMHLRAGEQNVDVAQGSNLAKAYFKIDLKTGEKELLIDGPDGWELNWTNGPLAEAWSSDNQSVLVSNAFLPLTNITGAVRASRAKSPCIAAVHLKTHEAGCVARLSDDLDYGESQKVVALRFDAASDKRVVVLYASENGRRWEVQYEENGASGWQPLKSHRGPLLPFQVKISQGLNDPPILVVGDVPNKAPRVLWNPNPSLKRLKLGVVEPVSWKDSTGLRWSGGLAKPFNFQTGMRYPLVILTHGFAPEEFLTCPWTVMVARPLAAVGIMALQVGDVRGTLVTQEEGPRQASSYDSAITFLAKQGLIDPTRVGIVGFSRSVYYAAEALTDVRFRYAAASLSDGVDGSYWQYLYSEFGNNDLASEYVSMFGGAPFGSGLRKWLTASPGFRLQRMTAPVLLLEPGAQSILANWDIYASLRRLQRPVELIDLGDGSHPLSNPAQQFTAETLNVDWFRFWLQDYEDPDPAKAEQYRRWEKLCDMQKAANPDKPTFCVGTKH
jgi:dipeptidyl aminopeptidase/acylaminoacyl peptidase